jgi:hypothetical protein
MDMTRFDEFKQNAKADVKAYQKLMQDSGAWDLMRSAKLLSELQNKMNYRLMNYLFGVQLGGHLWDEFKHQHGGCVLRWFNRLNEEFYVYVLHEVKNNTTLYANC